MPTLEKQSPIVPVPQQISTTVDSIVGWANSMADWYKISAPFVLIWKNASGDILNLSPRSVSWTWVAPHRCSGVGGSTPEVL